MSIAGLGALLFFVRRYPLGAIGALIMIAFVATAIFADAITTYDPLTTNARASLAPPGGEHTLGADFMGRDVLVPHHLRRAHLAGGRRSARRRSAA